MRFTYLSPGDDVTSQKLLIYDAMIKKKTKNSHTRICTVYTYIYIYIYIYNYQVINFFR